MDKVQMLLEKMEQLNIKLDLVTYSTIIKGFAVKGDLEEALEVFLGMPNHEVGSDAIIFNTLLDGCIRHSRFDFADKLIADMDKYKINPSNFTLTTLVKLWGRRHEVDKAFEVVDQLPKKFSFQVNCQVYTCLISACLSNHASKRALEVFMQMKMSKTHQPDEKTYSTLISGLARSGEWEQALQLVDEAFGLQGMPPALPEDKPLETAALEQLLKCLAQRGMSEMYAVPLLERMRAAKAPVDARLYTMSLQQAVADQAGAGLNRRRPAEQFQRRGQQQ